MKTLIVDIEADGLLDTITKIHCIVTKDHDTGEIKRYNDQGNLWWDGDYCSPLDSGLEVLSAAGTRLVFHNGINFDIPAIKQLYPDWEPRGEVFDTQVASRVIWSDLSSIDFRNPSLPKSLIGRHSLKAWGYRLGILKGTYGEDTEQAWENWSPELEDYCEQDVHVTHEFYKKILSKDYSVECLNLEHDFAWLIARQMRHGFQFNEAKAVELFGTISKRMRELEETLQSVFPPRKKTLKTPQYWYVIVDGIKIQEETKTKLTQELRRRKLKVAGLEFIEGPKKFLLIPFNPGSNDQVAARLIETYGWKPTEYTEKGKPKVSEEIISELPYPEIAPLKEYVLLSKRAGMLATGNEAWLKHVRNGRIHGRVITNGTATGRASHSSPNMGQVVAPYSPYGHECRELFEASDGMVLVGWDGSGIQARCLAHYLAKYDGGEYIKVVTEGNKEDETDVHSVNAKAIGLNPKAQYEFSGKKGTGRDFGKTFLYCLIFGGGDAKVGSITGKGAIAGRAMKERFFAAIPAFKRLILHVQKTAKERGFLRGLDGRKIPVRSPHSALNFILQGAEAVLMKKAHCIHIKKLEELDWWWGADYAKVNDVHDEAEWECRPELADTLGTLAIQSLKESGEYFGFRCPLDGEYKIGKNWAEVH